MSKKKILSPVERRRRARQEGWFGFGVFVLLLVVGIYLFRGPAPFHGVAGILPSTATLKAIFTNR